MHTSFADHVDGNNDVPMRCQGHRPIQQVYGYPRWHWLLPFGKYSTCITPADACGIVKLLSKASIQKAKTNHLLSSSKQQAV
jgi:hypothetical protein